MCSGKFVLALLAVAGIVSAHAEDYPAKPIRLVVPFEAGGTVDALGRVVSNQIMKQSGALM